MKTLQIAALIAFIIMGTQSAMSQSSKEPASCKMYLDGKVVTEITLEDAVKWCELTPPTVQCDDGKIYKLELFSISYLTLKPFLSRDFGVGEGGFPIRALEAVKAGKSGDTIILKDVSYTNEAGIKSSLPVMSFKIK